MTPYSIDQDVLTTSAPTFDGATLTGTLTMDAAAINEAEEFEVSSSSTTAIGAAPSNNVRIAGSTTIAAFDVAPAGVTRRVRFSGALTLTHSATLQLPGAANILTAAGDCLLAQSLGAGIWKVMFFQAQSGLVPGVGTMATQNADDVAITGGALDSVTITNSTFTADAGGLKVEDANGDTLSIATGELTTNRTFTIDPADGSRTLTVSVDVTLDQSVATSSSPQFAAINVGHASDTTVGRASAGDIAVEGNVVYRAGGTDVAVADGGTGASTAAGARTNLGLVIGTDVQAYDADLAALAALTPGNDNIIVGNGTAWVTESGDTARTSLGVGSADTVQHAILGLGAARTEGVLQVAAGSAGTVTAISTADEIVVEGSASAGISILTPDASTAAIVLGSPSDNRGAGLEWNYASLAFNVGSDTVGGLTRLRAGDAVAIAELTTSGMAVHASGVTPQHDGVLHALSGSAGTVTASTDSDELVVESGGNGGMSILTPAANYGILSFGSPASNQQAKVYWSDSSSLMQVGTLKSGAKLRLVANNNQEVVEVTSAGASIYANGVTPQHDAPLHVLYDTAGSVTAFGGAVIVAEGSNSVVTSQVLHTDANSGAFMFGCPSDNAYGYIKGRYSAGSPEMDVFLGSSNAATFTQTSGIQTLTLRHPSATSPNGIFIDFTGKSTGSSGDFFLSGRDTGATRINIAANGTVTNATGVYAAISDARLKQDVVLAGSQWNDVKALGSLTKKYRFRSDVATDSNAAHHIGLIAQDVLNVSPGLVQTGADGHYSVQYSVLYMKAFKALGEALERIERLEAQLAAKAA